MEKEKQTPATYDEMFEAGGAGGVFDLHYRHSGYFPLFRAVAGELDRLRASRVLEVGCGTGALAHLLFETRNLTYRGFDFSSVAVEKAKLRTGRSDCFYEGDATSRETYGAHDYDTVVCTEVLEHIESDIDAIRNWRTGAHCVCSVPNYDSATHVRVFRSEQEVRDRYESLIEIDAIQRLKKPFLSDISFSSVLRAVKWNRYRPRRLAWIAGFTDFDSDGGWFVFSGRRR